ncbi:MAG: PhzF family phenazine biosynthesis protein [Ignavibacteriaceae bacterium]|jgi:trans-2,3-dihydro-3-hydroxyanthranilate isomerase|nr:PhzF family phenazine biosynthesis protein [Ignavibacteriaceae bacterium]
MKKLTDVCQIDAFTDEPFLGNSAGVVYSDDLTKDEMQLIAKEFNVSETAFISKSSEADFNLQWFTPTVEVKLCGHATIASIHFLKQMGIVQDNSSITFKTLSGILKGSTKNRIHSLGLPVPELKIFEGNKEEIIKALNGEKVINPEKFPFILDDGGYLYIHISSLNELMNLKPDYKALMDLSCTRKGYDAFTLFTTETIKKENHAHLRFFAPFYGIDEDPVTGSANGPLLLVIQKLKLTERNIEGKIFTFEQGDVLGRKGRINVSLSSSKNELTIAGKAVTVFKGELTF